MAHFGGHLGRSGIALVLHTLRDGTLHDNGRWVAEAAYGFARVLVTDLAEVAARAVRETDGARWSDVEHRPTPGDLEPGAGRARSGHRPDPAGRGGRHVVMDRRVRAGE
ncbi:hypothetical protein [Streptomyces sp. NPDC005760]|uniref:hypothetical protein n=1 Tax=Streptomyces sp. NPDC005760 TaxID=3156718 RepID=UPI003405EDD7